MDTTKRLRHAGGRKRWTFAHRLTLPLIMALGAVVLAGPSGSGATAAPGRGHRIVLMEKQRQLAEKYLRLYHESRAPHPSFNLSPRGLYLLQAHSRTEAAQHFAEAMAILHKLHRAHRSIPKSEEAGILSDYAWFILSSANRPLFLVRVNGKMVPPSQVQPPVEAARKLIGRALTLAPNDPVLWAKKVYFDTLRYDRDHATDKKAAVLARKAWGRDSRQAIVCGPLNPIANLCRAQYLPPGSRRQCRRFLLFLKNRRATNMEALGFRRWVYRSAVAIAWATLRERCPQMLKELPKADYERLGRECKGAFAKFERPGVEPH